MPYLPVAATASVVMMLAVARGPIRDIDLFWHLLVGQEILHGTPVAEAGRGWSFAPVPDTWVSTQWLSEVLFASLNDVGGLAAFPVFRTVTAGLSLLVLAGVTLWRRPVRAGVWAFSLAGLQMTLFAQDRSQQFTFILAPLVGYWGEQVVRRGRLPRWWVVLPLVLVWSNLHGGWVLVPFALAVGGLARLVDEGWRTSTWWRAWVLAAASTGAALVSPAGLTNVLAFVRFSGSTGHIGEWSRVSVWNWQAIPFLLLVAVVLSCWLLGPARPTRGEVVFLAAVVVFGFAYWRNVTPTSLMLAPFVTGVVARALRLPDPTPPGQRTPMRRLSLVIAAVGAALAIAMSAIQVPVVQEGTPLTLLARLHAATAPQRVLNTYNLSGLTLWFAGPPPHVTVGIDGRADRYGDEYIGDYQDTLLGAREGWETMLDQLHPTAAVLSGENALAGVLVTQRHWVVVDTQDGYQLLHAPDAPGW